VSGVWPTKTLDEIFEIARGGSPRPIQDFLTEDIHGVNWVMISDATSSDKFIEKTAKRIRSEGAYKSRMVRSGDFLLTNSMSFGRPYIMRTDGCIHDGWLLLRRRREDVHEDYFYHLLSSPGVYAQFERLAAGATVKNLNSDLVRSVSVPFPPKEEQKRIAAILDKADSLRRKRREAIRLADDLLRSTLLTCLKQPYDALVVEQLLSMKKNAIRTGPFGSQLLHAEFTESGVPVLGIDNVVTNRFRWDERRYISAEKYEQLSRYTVYPGDVMVTIMGTTGRVAVAPDDLPICISTKHLCTMTVDRTKILPEFLWACLLWDPAVRAQSSRESKGAIMDGLNMGIVKGLLIKVPSMDVQQRFVSVLRKVDALRSKYKVAVDDGASLNAALTSRLLAGPSQH